MKTRLCPVKECGAVVHLLPVEGRELAVDPAPIEVLVPQPGDGYRLVSGYRPHWASCVDIRGRRRMDGRMEGKA